MNPMSGIAEELGRHMADVLTRDTVRMTVGGAVKFDGGYIHPESYRELMGEDAYQELLALPRVVCEYDEEEE